LQSRLKGFGKPVKHIFQLYDAVSGLFNKSRMPFSGLLSKLGKNKSICVSLSRTRKLSRSKSQSNSDIPLQLLDVLSSCRGKTGITLSTLYYGNTILIRDSFIASLSYLTHLYDSRSRRYQLLIYI
jgi:hypothetical protein